MIARACSRSLFLTKGAGAANIELESSTRFKIAYMPQTVLEKVSFVIEWQPVLLDNRPTPKLARCAH